MTQATGAAFAGSVACLTEPALTGLSDQLARVPGLGPAERAVILESTRATLCDALLRKVNRVLVLELNIARVTGKLTADDPAARWSQFLRMSEGLPFWESLSGQYPTMLDQLRAVIAGRCAAAAAVGQRLGADRPQLVGLLGGEPGELTGIAMGAGDSHRGGQTVSVLELTGGSVVYKPRSVHVDEVLSEFLAVVLGDVGDTSRIRVPRVVARRSTGGRSMWLTGIALGRRSCLSSTAASVTGWESCGCLAAVTCMRRT
ncbi:MAG: DUF4135 domain-containing protein [Streptosporangiaceae bacterium]